MRSLDWRARLGVARGTLALVAVGGGAAVAGCVIIPYTGLQQSADPAGTHMSFSGRSDTAISASNPVKAWVLANATANTHSGTYTLIGTTTATTPPLDGHDSVPYFNWSITSSALTNTQWPAGGLARFRVTSKFNGNSTAQDMTTFDNEGLNCLVAESSNPWRSAGYDCRSPYTNNTLITVVSTTTNPAEASEGYIEYLGLGAMPFI